MPRLPPTTPFLPRLNHPPDESLLLASPVFDDITLDDSDFWAVPPAGRSLVARTPSSYAGPSRPSLASASTLPLPPTTASEDRSGQIGSASERSKQEGGAGKGNEIADFTLDLDAYLPGDDSVFIEEDTILVGRGQRLSAGHGEAHSRAEGSCSDVSSGSLKRGGGDTPMRACTNPKKARPPTPVRDDFYARRLSDTDRRGSFSTARPVPSPTLPVLHLRTSSSSSSLRRMSVFSSTGFSEGDTFSAVDGAIRNGQSRVGRMEMDVKHINTPPLSSSSLPSSSLSGFLSSPHGVDQPPPPSIPGSLLGASETPDPASGTRPSVKLDPIRPLRIPDMAPSSASPSISTVSMSMSLLRRSLSLNLSTSRTSSPGQDVARQSPLRAVEPSPTPSRRESAGEKVLGFIAGFVKRSSSGLAGTKEARPTESPTEIEARPTITQSISIDENTPTPTPTATSSSSDCPAESTPATLISAPSTARPQVQAPPRFRGPYVAPLTRPISPPRATASRALKPARTTAVPNSSTMAISAKNRPVTTSAFVSAALKRLPPAGKGSTAAGNPVQVRAVERAADLSSRRDVFERLASGSSIRQHRPTSTSYVAPPPPPPRKTTSLPRTVPIRGHTPGKASLARAREREKFDAAVKSRLAAKEREKAGHGE